MHAGAISIMAFALSTLQLDGKVQLLLDHGVIEHMVIASFNAYQARGAAKIEDTNPLVMFSMSNVLATLDLTASEAKPIIRLLKEATSALRFLFDNPAGEAGNPCPSIFNVQLV